MRIVWQTAQRITDKILGAKGLKAIETSITSGVCIPLSCDHPFRSPGHENMFLPLKMVFFFASLDKQEHINKIIIEPYGV